MKLQVLLFATSCALTAWAESDETLLLQTHAIAEKALSESVTESHKIESHKIEKDTNNDFLKKMDVSELKNLAVGRPTAMGPGMWRSFESKYCADGSTRDDNCGPGFQFPCSKGGSPCTYDANGMTTQSDDCQSVCHTGSGHNAWWEVKLAEPSLVESVLVVNAWTHGFKDRIIPFHIYLLDGAGDTIASKGFTQVQDAFVWQGANTADVQKVKVMLDGSNYLHMAEVFVMGRDTVACQEGPSVGIPGFKIPGTKTSPPGIPGFKIPGTKTSPKKEFKPVTWTSFSNTRAEGNALRFTGRDYGKTWAETSSAHTSMRFKFMPDNSARQIAGFSCKEGLSDSAWIYDAGVDAFWLLKNVYRGEHKQLYRKEKDQSKSYFRIDGGCTACTSEVQSIDWANDVWSLSINSDGFVEFAQKGSVFATSKEKPHGLCIVHAAGRPATAGNIITVEADHVAFPGTKTR